MQPTRDHPLAANVRIEPPPGAASSISAANSMLELAVLHIQTPSTARDSLRSLWRHVREDVTSGQAQMQLRRNGLRIGVGSAELWEPVRAALASVADHRVTLAQPVRIPRAFPLALELDDGPRDQTLFCMRPDGVLNGETWPNSRNVLKITYEPELSVGRIARIVIVPEVRQQLEGLRYVRNEAGLWRAPRQNVRVFHEVGVELNLNPSEFVLIGPSDEADLFGVLGGVLLTTDIDNVRFDSFVVLRPEVRHVD